MDDVSRIADAVLYEGYVLWPYRRSAVKNQRRWTFGGIYPAAHSAAHPDDPALMQTECLVEGAAPRLELRVRFLHVVLREVARRSQGALETVDQLEIDGERHLSWDEATEREVCAQALKLDALEAPARLEIEVPAGTSEEELRDRNGDPAGAIVRSWRALRGAVEVSATPLGAGLQRLRVRIANASKFDGADREEALRQTFCSAHTVLRVEGGTFASQTDPPATLREQAEACESVGTWPVLVGGEGERHTMLSSPIILPDYPQVAPESPGDMFDAAEIDQLLRLSILALTEEEKEQMRASDPKAREILERTESLSQEELMRLHGAIRELSSLRPA